MPHKLDVTKYRTVSGYVLTTTTDMDTGAIVVNLRVDTPFDDGQNLTPTKARSLARALDEYAKRAEQVQAQYK